MMKRIFEKLNKVACLIVLNLFLTFYSIVLNSENLAMFCFIAGMLLVSYDAGVKQAEKKVFEAKIRQFFKKYCLRKT